jgi:hypothetical protein
MSLKKSQGKAVQVTVNSKEENSLDFVWISSKNSATVHCHIKTVRVNICWLLAGKLVQTVMRTIPIGDCLG